mmetsp:Transcript_34157/g.80099  ORF Transcript_34157/g.80099 Transcript_34157/m.80099 type:complete len:98 (-) Transcript_34157:138-431(-)
MGGWACWYAVVEGGYGWTWPSNPCPPYCITGSVGGEPPIGARGGEEVTYGAGAPWTSLKSLGAAGGSDISAQTGEVGLVLGGPRLKKKGQLKKDSSG